MLNLTVDHSVKSDHFAILFTLPLTAPTKAKMIISMRKLKAIDIQAFSDSIIASKLQQQVRAADSATEAYELYNTTLREVLDDHAPVTQRTITTRSECPWFTTNIKLAKAKRKRLEKQWRRTRLTVHHEIYTQQRDLTNSLIQEAKKDYYHNKLSVPNQKDLYTVANDLLHRTKQKVYPSQYPKDELPDKFASFFHNKIEKLHASLTGTGQPSTQQQEQQDLCPANMSVLVPANEEEIKRLLRSSKPKTCDLDPVPSHLLRQCETSVIPTLTDIVNKSLTHGMPSKMKQAIVTPLLKKPTLNSDEFKNYRPVSNLSFVSKLTEKVVAARLIAHLQRNNLQEPLQSAYKQYCSIETALLKVQNDILHILDKRKGAALLLLDLSAAFDTIDHGILLHTLQHEVGITGQFLRWIERYLRDRSQAVRISGKQSENTPLTCGVPQGSVLGPLLFSIYTIPLARIIRSHGLSYHLYADDTQLYLELCLDDSSSQTADIRRVERCVADIREWMRNNMLMLNDDKTELLIFHPKSTDPVDLPQGVIVGNSSIPPSKTAKNLGVIFDTTMSLSKHISGMSRAAYYHLRAIGRIRRYLDRQSTKQLVHALVISRLDGCNSLLYGLPDTLLKQLQRVQNACARMVMKCSKREHITPLLQELHWLPVHARIEYKVIFLTFKCLNNLAPTYLADLITLYHPTRCLRSADKRLLMLPPSGKKRFKNRSFAYAAPLLWNKLPEHMRLMENLSQFKTSLKTLFFTREFY